jgi:hypothetical protein
MRNARWVDEFSRPDENPAGVFYLRGSIRGQLQLGDAGVLTGFCPFGFALSVC